MICYGNVTAGNKICFTFLTFLVSVTFLEGASTGMDKERWR